MTARDYALIQLDRLDLPGWRAGTIRSGDPKPPTDPRDLGLAEQIRTGVVKNLLLLNFLIDHYRDHRGKIDPLVRKILAIGIYQLRFLTRIPASAAVDQAVEQVKRYGSRHAAGVVNAILRRATREPDVQLPDETADPQLHAEIALSHPRELFDKLVGQIGAENAIKFCRHSNAEPPTLVRAITGATFPPPILPDGVTVSPHELPGMWIASGARKATFADWAKNGLAQVQDATSARVIEHLDLQDGSSVLDRCAGLGTKTIQIRERIGKEGSIVAVDPSEARYAGLLQTLKVRKISNVAVVQAEMLRKIPNLKRESFDRVLIDAPCSNSGVLARRPEARYSQDKPTTASVVKLQRQILDDTSEYLKRGGLMIYSTCSVWQEENEQQVAGFLGQHGDYELVEAQLTWPSFKTPDPARYHDGGFFALLRRR